MLAAWGWGSVGYRGVSGPAWYSVAHRSFDGLEEIIMYLFSKFHYRVFDIQSFIAEYSSISVPIMGTEIVFHKFDWNKEYTRNV